MSCEILIGVIIFLTITIDVNSILVPQGISVYPEDPIWSGYLADPFAFEFNGTYYMIGTGLGLSENNDTFPSLISHDLITWNYSGDVLYVINQPDQPNSYWAPEITEKDHIFYLFYSVGFGENKHRLRVASSTSPLGPYNDSQSIELTDVTKLSFAIDPHPFQDRNDGLWYLFYSRDFLDINDGYRVGTGIVVDRLIDNMTRLAGNETIVLRAKHDWQIYQSNRSIYDHIYDWYTLEGAAVWQEPSGAYICFYSGSNWQNTTYGIDYGIAYSSPMGPYTEDSTNQPRITYSIEGIILGPGHNSIINGRDRQTTYIVYHAWNQARTIRSPYISQLYWKPKVITNNSNSGKDILHVTLLFLVYIIVLFMIFHHAL
jgi:GH43 family beta-xylosidase